MSGQRRMKSVKALPHHQFEYSYGPLKNNPKENMATTAVLSHTVWKGSSRCSALCASFIHTSLKMKVRMGCLGQTRTVCLLLLNNTKYSMCGVFFTQQWQLTQSCLFLFLVFSSQMWGFLSLLVAVSHTCSIHHNASSMFTCVHVHITNNLPAPKIEGCWYFQRIGRTKGTCNKTLHLPNPNAHLQLLKGQTGYCCFSHLAS